jgi:hypothetical protein
VLLDTKILYDQARRKKSVDLQNSSFEEGELSNPYYIYTQEQLLEEWFQNNNYPVNTHTEAFSHLQNVEALMPPSSKQAVFKWAFAVPDTGLDPNEHDAVRHLLKVMEPFTGKSTPLSYRESRQAVGAPPRNRYLVLQGHYKAVVDYIEANILVISLQVEDDILESLGSILKKKVSFEERYFMPDESSIRETINSLENQDLSSFYHFFIDFVEMNKQVAQKMEGRHYVEKKEHWVVHDEIIDFLMSRIQGYGLIRQSYLPLADDLRMLKDVRSPASFLAAKTRNIYKLIHLAGYETYLNGINDHHSDFHTYLPLLAQWLCQSPLLADYTCAQSTNARVDIASSGPSLSQSLEEERLRFKEGIYAEHSNMLCDRMKYVVPTAAHSA